MNTVLEYAAVGTYDTSPTVLVLVQLVGMRQYVGAVCTLRYWRIDRLRFWQAWHCKVCNVR